MIIIVHAGEYCGGTRCRGCGYVEGSSYFTYLLTCLLYTSDAADE